eukprot:2179444-Pleurochrysis_carterae.AAC.1
MKSCVNHFKISAHHALPFIEIAADCDLGHRAQPASLNLYLAAGGFKVREVRTAHVFAHKEGAVGLRSRCQSACRRGGSPPHRVE